MKRALLATLLLLGLATPAQAKQPTAHQVEVAVWNWGYIVIDDWADGYRWTTDGTDCTKYRRNPARYRCSLWGHLVETETGNVVARNEFRLRYMRLTKTEQEHTLDSDRKGWHGTVYINKNWSGVFRVVIP